MGSGIFNTENRLLLGKREATAGLKETLASEDGDVRVRSVEISDLGTEFDDESSKYLTGDHTHDEAIAGINRANIAMGIKVAPFEFHYTDGVLTETRIPYLKYFEGAGLKAVVTEPTDELTEDGYVDLYPQKSADSQTLTMALYDVETGDNPVGIQYLISGAMGTLNIGAEGSGKPFMSEFEFSGKVGEDDVVEIPNASLPSYDDSVALSTLADKMLYTDVIIEEVNRDGTSAGNTPIEFCVNTANIDTGVQVAEIPCQSGGSGIKHHTITTRDPRVNFDPLLRKLSDFDFWKAVTKEKIFKITIVSYRDSAKTKELLRYDAPRCQLTNPSGSDSNGFRRNAFTFRPLRNLQGATPEEKEHDYKLRIGGLNVIV